MVRDSILSDTVLKNYIKATMQFDFLDLKVIYVCRYMDKICNLYNIRNNLLTERNLPRPIFVLRKIVKAKSVDHLEFRSFNT